jgi:hypothetical protein
MQLHSTCLDNKQCTLDCVVLPRLALCEPGCAYRAEPETVCCLSHCPARVSVFVCKQVLEAAVPAVVDALPRLNMQMLADVLYSYAVLGIKDEGMLKAVAEVCACVGTQSRRRNTHTHIKRVGIVCTLTSPDTCAVLDSVSSEPGLLRVMYAVDRCCRCGWLRWRRTQMHRPRSSGP